MYMCWGCKIELWNCIYKNNRLYTVCLEPYLKVQFVLNLIQKFSMMPPGQFFNKLVQKFRFWIFFCKLAHLNNFYKKWQYL